MILNNLNPPSRSGVYLMKDEKGAVIYVGKAKNLKKRIESYLREKDFRPQIAFLLKRLKKIDFIVTNNEKEALILENNLIKKYKPKYNIQLKDDKNYLCLKIDKTKNFPKLEFVRKIVNDGSVYFGPYPSAKTIREIISTIGKVFPLRRCSDRAFENRKKPCLYFEMQECIAPCVNKDKEEEYKKILKEVELFLSGNTEKVIKMLEKKMWQFSERQEYEKSAFLRDLIRKIRIIEEKQGVLLQKYQDVDAIGTFIYGEKINIVILFIRGGKLINKKTYTHFLGPSEEETLSQFIMSFYNDKIVPPEIILTDKSLEDKKFIEEEFEKIFCKKIKIMSPKDEETKKLIELANLNASSFSKDFSETDELRRLLNLDKDIKRIECYDASHIFGKLNLCAMVVYENGQMKKNEYRVFNISEEGYNDLQAIKEALERRLNHTEWQYPDLIVIDGGKSQLSTAVKVLKEKGLKDIAVIAFAKDENNSIYIPNRKNPLLLKKESKALKILSLLRASAHKFANSHLAKRIKKKSGEKRVD